ncbi:hypothetical protein ASN18_0321 [Candidatus Magnetominusculus xianensis]|uniref:Secreted protein n=1 Tax=Candidatus Magnetominusculus xianensis TaxID=1748249 RepID=A0ABR5SJ07_9BACT|nr:hypothetical protein ASN18_0321 [Candidatus Magnetominusculus xianensis]
MTPRPIFLLDLVISSILSRGYLFKSITLSRKWTALCVTAFNLSQSTVMPPSRLTAILERFIEPRLQDSKGRSGCSPHGFVASILPTSGVGFDSFILSMNMMPGSPFSHACFTIKSNTYAASSLPVPVPPRGFISSYSEFELTASINFVVSAADILKLFSFVLLDLHVIKSMMSGWSTLRMAMLAPRRVPPCLTASVAVSKTAIKDTGPLDMPFVEPTTSPFGRSDEKLKPVPPPDL